MPSQKELESSRKKEFRLTLDTLLHYAYEDFKILVGETPHLQSEYIRTYLWLSTLLIAFDVTLYTKILKTNSEYTHFCDFNLSITPSFYIFALLSIISLFISFLLGVDTLRGKCPLCRPFGEFSNLINDAWSEIIEGDDCIRSSVLTQITEEIDKQEDYIDSIGKRLHIISPLIIFGSISTVFSIISTIIPKVINQYIVFTILCCIILFIICCFAVIYNGHNHKKRR